MSHITSQQTYLTTGLAILNDPGSGGLKLANLCGRLGVTSGSFYHFFDNWSSYVTQLMSLWTHGSEKQLSVIREIDDADQRLEAMREQLLTLPHCAEGSLRIWSTTHSEVNVARRYVDAERSRMLTDAAYAITGDTTRAEMYARSVLYLLIGHQQYTANANAATLASALELLRRSIKSPVSEGDSYRLSQICG